MTGIDGLALCGLPAVMAAFLLPGRWFAGGVILVEGALAIAGACLAEGADGWMRVILLLAGSGFVALGLAGVRVMARRSVSLAMLEQVAGGADTSRVYARQVLDRLDDLREHRLATPDAAGWRLTARGRFWAHQAHVLCIVLGVRP